MCNQFRIPKLALIKQYLTEDLDLPLVEPKINDEEKDVFPNQTAPVLLYQNKQLQLVNKNWGYPSPVDANKPLFNARIERFYEQKPSMWDESFAKQRCIILASEFFEYAKNTYQADNGKKYHERYSFKSKQPITVTTIKKKFFELTPVLLPISLAKYDILSLDIFLKYIFKKFIFI